MQSRLSSSNFGTQTWGALSCIRKAFAFPNEKRGAGRIQSPAHRFRTTAAAALLLAASALFVSALPGDPDESYGTTGYYVDNQPATTAEQPEGTSFFDGELQADSKLVSVGTFSYFISTQNFGYTTDFYVQRLLPNGQRDPSFGNIGTGKGNAPGSVRLNNLFPLGTEAVARAVKIQQDNKIVIAGFCNIWFGLGGQTQSQTGYGMCAARLNPNGTLDTSFGGNNFVVQHSLTDPSQSVNYTMPAGTTFVHYPGQFETGYAGRYNSNYAGALDVAIHSDGRIVLAGYGAQREFNAQNQFQGYNHVAAVVTLAPNGGLSSVYTTGGDQGFVDARRTRGRAFYQVETQTDGNFVAVGNNLHLNNDGFVDGNRWILTNGSATWTSENFAAGDALASSLKLTRGNKILVGGWTTQPGGIFPVGAIMSFNSNLTPDTTFGGGSGRVIYCRGEIPCQVLPFSIKVKLASVQNDGNILGIAVGRGDPYRNPQSPEGGETLLRFNPDGSIDRSFGDAYGNNANNITSYGYSVLHRQTAQGIVQAIGEAPFAVLQTDGKILAGGTFFVPGQGLGSRAGVTRRQNTLRSASGGILSDFDNDGRADLATFNNGTWTWRNSFNSTTTTINLGSAADRIAPADYDGDGRTDAAVFRDGVWTIQQSSDGQRRTVNFGTAEDIPRPGDFNGDGQADFGVYRPASGTWRVLLSHPILPGNITELQQQLGGSGSVPLIGDFDGDGKSDFAVFTSGVWSHVRSKDGQTVTVQLGEAGDVPVVGDYDGDSISDRAVFRPANATWLIELSNSFVTAAQPRLVAASPAQQFGRPGDVPVPGDYDRDGKLDLAVYRDGAWRVLQSSDGETVTTEFGEATAIPVPGAVNSTGGPLLNISTRLRVGTGENALIGGFIITGTEPKRVIIRAIGPSLGAQGVSGALADTTLELFDGSGTSMSFNDNWKDSQQAEINATTIPPGNELESAIVRTLSPGNYTAVVRGKNDSTGVGLVEVYDLVQGAQSKLANISSRGFVETGENVLIGGFIVGAGGAQGSRVVVRALGPSLGAAGVVDALQDPTLQLVNANGTELRANDNWKDGGQRSELEALSIQPRQDLEAALIATVGGGNYTAIVRGKDGSTGVGLVEVYNVQ